MRPIPDELLRAPFLRSRARELGISSRSLQGARFERVYPRVWRVVGDPLSDEDRVSAARLAMPDSAHLTGLSRIRQLGLDFGPRLPVHFVVQGDLHLAFEHVFLHRTVKLPPVDEHGVCVEAAFVSYCRFARVIDAIQVGDWLLRHGHLHLDALVEFASAEPWRDGAPEALWITEHLDGRSRSVKESETRAVICFAGLPRPEVNVELPVVDGVAIGDLVFVAYGVVVEYEGDQHQTDREQYRSDIRRYGSFRAASLEYVQVTREGLRRPRRVVVQVHDELVKRGYDGPAPLFGAVWRQLFGTVSHAVGPRPPSERRRAS